MKQRCAKCNGTGIKPVHIYEADGNGNDNFSHTEWRRCECGATGDRK